MNKMKKERILQIAIIIILDIIFLYLVDFCALFIRFEFSVSAIPDIYKRTVAVYFPFRVILTVALFSFTRMYSYVWRTISIRDVSQMILTVIAAFILNHIVFRLTGHSIPRSLYFIQLVLQLFLHVGMRCALRFWHVIKNELAVNDNERIMLIGAGAAGRVLTREIAASHKIPGRIICAIDDNESKWGKYMDGVKIVGGRDQIISTAKRENITQIIYAIPGASPGTKKEILEICKETGCRLRSLPGIFQLVNGEVTVDAVKDVQVEDLLGREPVKLDLATLKTFLADCVVLVTGGGGSIGSELCRQIAKYAPKQLIILDIYENNAYDIQQELVREYGARLDLRVEIASVRDKEKIYELFAKYRPDIVFHAAAHKHVPLMENCPSEAIKNNIFGTYHVIRAAEDNLVKKFVMISTDKAVNPTNVMGATKRFCEMILQSRQGSQTEFCAVRFGNVLGSNGSVVPLFKKQIANGGPVTITDKRIIRYFMTIPEAAQLVLEAGAMATSGQIFVLDMGEPVKILTLAENLIRLSGKEPYQDIAIEEIGLRPGEKLYEELLMSSEKLSATVNSKIYVEEQNPIDRDEILRKLTELGNAIDAEKSKEELTALLKSMVPTFRDPNVVNAEAVQNIAKERDTRVAAKS